MNISRDRMSRPVDISSMLECAERRVDLVVDEPGLHWTGLSTQNISTGQNASASGGGSGGGGGGDGGGVSSSGRRQKVGLRRIRRCRGVNKSFVGKENQWPNNLRKGQGRGSVLPSWYPRTPLRDITAIVRAIEKKRAELYGNQTTETSQSETDGMEAPNNQLDHETSTSKPISKACKDTVKVHADRKGKDVDFTPQKKLLNSIDKVRQNWLEDQKKQERTPAKKKAERQKMVRVLMSMR